MAKGKQKHDEYSDALSLLGKDLTRRAKSRCELSGESGPLSIYDLEGPKVEPDLDHVVLVCARVRDHLEGRGLKASGANQRTEMQESDLYYLQTAVWSSEPAVRRAAVRILEQIQAPWAEEAIANAQMMDENTAEPSFD